MSPSHLCKSVSVALLVLLSVAYASSGDRAEEFQFCIAACPVRDCQLALSQRLAFWTCLDDCKYQCMHRITDRAIQIGIPIQQYHGKWPFWRFFGMQEPASVLFSLLNLWSHIVGAKLVTRKIPENHPLKGLYLWWAAVSVNAWIWSAVFHSRDLPLTEKLDYFAAALAILFALYCTVIRLLHLYRRPDRFRLAYASSEVAALPDRSRWLIPWSFICVLCYLAHVAYLSMLPRFDYTYNIIFNSVIGLMSNILWLLYSLPSSLTFFRRFPSLLLPESYRPPYAYKAGLFVILMTVATALELFEFSPWWRIIDAHSLWHLSTAPLALFWYMFLVQDALDNGWRPAKF